MPNRVASWALWLRPTTPWGRVPISLLISLVLLTIGAWSLTIYQALNMSMPMGIAVSGGIAMDGMDGMAGMAMSGITANEWSLGGAIIFVAIWTVMMAAMMLPAAAPMIFIFASAQARRALNAAIPTWIFIAGYILVWAAAGILVYVVVQLGNDLAMHLTPSDRIKWAPLALGSTLISAGLYQFTPLKRVCLSHCRSPFAFVAQHWREGRVGALSMGLRHGAYCFGCCWAWMLLLTLVVFVEKVLTPGRQAAVATGIALFVLGVVVAGGAVQMPWLA